MNDVAVFDGNFGTHKCNRLRIFMMNVLLGNDNYQFSPTLPLVEFDSVTR